MLSDLVLKKKTKKLHASSMNQRALLFGEIIRRFLLQSKD